MDIGAALSHLREQASELYGLIDEESCERVRAFEEEKISLEMLIISLNQSQASFLPRFRPNGDLVIISFSKKISDIHCSLFDCRVAEISMSDNTRSRKGRQNDCTAPISHSVTNSVSSNRQ